MNNYLAAGIALCAWLLIAVCTWFLVTFIIWIATDMSYITALTCKLQEFLAAIMYWWLPALPFSIGTWEKYRD